MRKALNENRTVQLVVICVLLLGGALLLMTTMKGSDSETAGTEFPGSETPPATEVSVSASVNGESVGSTTVTVPQAGVAAAPTAPAPSASVSKAALKPGPGLPADLVNAWKAGDAVVLLIAKDSPIDDRLVRDSVVLLSAHPDTAVFVTDASGVSRYSRITQGIGVQRVPALVVIRPKSLSGSVPKATVEYGFRTAQGVEQAVDDALYSGPDKVPYHPG